MIEVIALEEAWGRIKISDLVSIDYEAFKSSGFVGNTWTEENFLYELPNKFVLSFLLFDDKKLVGYSIGYECADRWVHISRVAIHPSYQGRGLAKMILARQLKEVLNRNVRVLTIELSKDNKRAEALYRKIGFQHLNKKDLNQYIIARKRIYEEYAGEDSKQIVMAYNLTDLNLEVLFKEKELPLDESRNTPA